MPPPALRTPVADPLAIDRLRRRADFVALRKGPRASADAFVIQASRAADPERATLRVGNTVTKKIGNAVERNRIKRRLRAAVRIWATTADAAVSSAARGRDMVLVARRAALVAPFDALVADLDRAAARVFLESSRSKRHSERDQADSRAAVGAARDPRHGEGGAAPDGRAGGAG